jgi:RimJ/RimL family protein N-acetyltransferase
MHDSQSDAITFEFCRPVEEHARLVMNWRNDPVTLSFFFHRTPKVWPDFWHEFRDTYFVNRSGLHPVFALHQGHRIAFLKFSPVAHPSDASAPTVDISINLPPPSRGRGLGRKVLRACAEHLRAQGVHSIYAEVIEDNAASLKAFSAAGYRRLGKQQRTVEDTGDVFTVERFVFDMGGPDNGAAA